MDLLRDHIAAPGIAGVLGDPTPVFSERFRNFVGQLEPAGDLRTSGSRFGAEKTGIDTR